MKSKLIDTYSRLLADLATQTRMPLLEAYWDVSEEWVLTEAPKLDKAILALLELGHYLIPARQSDSVDREALGIAMFWQFFGTCDLSPNRVEMTYWLRELIEEFILSKSDVSEVATQYVLRLTRRVRVAHQSLVFCYKAEYEPTKEQLERSYKTFEENDKAVGLFDVRHNDRIENSALARVTRSLVARVIYRANWQEVSPRHGPGAVWPSVSPGEKSCFLTYYPTIDEVYPYTDWHWCLPLMWEALPSSQAVVTKEDIVCRIQAVPKDSRGPRLICVHPKEAVWTQQGTRHVLEHAITNSPLTRGKINFDDQSVNGLLALEASRTQDFTTLDLKDASDRLSAKVVRSLFGDHAYRYLACSRASKVQIGDRLIQLHKYAPMGNALTFPVQSLCFWAMVRTGIALTHGVNCDDVYVFGDDIVYPSKYHRGALAGLTQFGLVPNLSKTFVRGSFRESCGVDALAGTDITPLRLKVSEIATVTDAVAFCDLAKRARQHGLYTLAAHLYRQVEVKYGTLSMTNDPNCQGLVKYEDISWEKILQYEPRMVYDHHWHNYVVPTKLVMQFPMELPTHDWYHVQDSLMGIWRRNGALCFDSLIVGESALGRNEPSMGPVYSDRGLVYPDPRRLRLIRGWTPVLR